VAEGGFIIHYFFSFCLLFVMSCNLQPWVTPAPYYLYYIYKDCYLSVSIILRVYAVYSFIRIPLLIHIIYILIFMYVVFVGWMYGGCSVNIRYLLPITSVRSHFTIFLISKFAFNIIHHYFSPSSLILVNFFQHHSN
jgi:hypothetical protein